MRFAKVPLGKWVWAGWLNACALACPLSWPWCEPFAVNLSAVLAGSPETGPEMQRQTANTLWDRDPGSGGEVITGPVLELTDLGTHVVLSPVSDIGRSSLDH